MRVSGGLRKTPFQDWDGGVRGVPPGVSSAPLSGLQSEQGPGCLGDADCPVPGTRKPSGDGSCGGAEV